MAGLKELIEMESIEDQPTSSAPPNKSDYTKPYEPSMARGLAGIAVAGAGAYALRNPIGRIIQKIASIKLPKSPATRTSPKDQVEEVLEIAPTRMERGTALTKAQTKFQDEVKQIAIARSNELKKIAYHNPLSRGGKTNRIGSSLWDYIARHPISGARKAEDWIKDFKSTGPGSFKTGNPNFKSVDQAVKKEELWDSNLVQFDKNGNVIGGFLKTAAEKKLPLTKMDLLYIVDKAPVNNLKMRKLTLNTKVVDEAEDLSSEMRKVLGEVRTNAVKLGTQFPDKAEDYSDIVSSANAVAKNFNKKTSRLYNHYKAGDTSDYDDFDTRIFELDISDFKAVMDKARNLNIPVTHNIDDLITKANRVDNELYRKLQLQKTQGFLPKYGNYSEYRIRGGDEYFENVVYYPGKFPMGQRLGSDYNRHYSSDIGFTKPIPNQAYHVRGSIRTGGTAPNQKVMLIDEIQSDYHQHLRKVNPSRDKVVNTFGTEVEFFTANQKLGKIVNEMKGIANKGIRATSDDRLRFNKLNEEFKELKSNSMNIGNLENKNLRESIPFLPLYGKENWGSHALKNSIKDAADRGVQWVAIAPVENLHHVKRTKFLGDIEFYGTRTGKAGFRNYGGREGVMRKNANDREVPIDESTDPNKIATLPNAMKKLARQYNSEVKTIKIAKSDPERPFKVVVTNRGRKEFGLGESKQTEHVAAFKTEVEAEYYAGRYGGDVIKIMGDDAKNYFEAFAIKVSPEMKSKPFKAYHTGGLVVDIFAC